MKSKRSTKMATLNLEETSKLQSPEELNSELNLLLDAFKPCESIPGIITFKLNEGRTLLCFEHKNRVYKIENDDKILDRDTYTKVKTKLRIKRHVIPENLWNEHFKLAKLNKMS